MKIAAKFHLWSNKTRTEGKHAARVYRWQKSDWNSDACPYRAAILTIGGSGFGDLKDGQPDRRSPRWAGGQVSGPPAFPGFPVLRFPKCKGRRRPFSMTSFGSFNCRRFTFLPCLLGTTCASLRYKYSGTCIYPDIQIPVLYAASACIKPIKYVHVNALRAVFCAAIIKFLIVAFYSHVFSSSHCVSGG